jgi:hypothetical protein
VPDTAHAAEVSARALHAFDPDTLAEMGFNTALMDDLIAWVEEVTLAGAAAQGMEYGRGVQFAREYAEERAAQLVGLSPDGDGWKVNPDASWRIGDDIRDGIQSVVADGVSQGQTIAELARSVDTVMESALPYRSMMIARTESAFAFNAGVLGGMKEMGVTHVIVHDGMGDNPCPECEAIDGEVWTVAEAMANPIEHPNLIPNGTLVLPVGRLRIGFKARYRGPLITLTTAVGHSLTIGPHHPVLTGRGWVPANEVKVGDEVVVKGRPDRSLLPVELDGQKVEALVEDVFDSLGASGATAWVPAARDNFHGDGEFCEGKVYVVWAEGELPRVRHAQGVKDTGDLTFPWADTKAEALARLCPRNPDGQPIPPPESGEVTSDHSFGGVIEAGIPSGMDARLLQPMGDEAVANLQLAGELSDALPFKVTLSEVANVSYIASAVCHAYDLHTSSSVYFADGILIHNCTRAFEEILPEDMSGEDDGEEGEEV